LCTAHECFPLGTWALAATISLIDSNVSKNFFAAAATGDRIRVSYIQGGLCMIRRNCRLPFVFSAMVLVLVSLSVGAVFGQTPKEHSLKGMKYRLIGPFRGGRVLAVTGVAQEPNTYYFGAVAGGVWKTTNGGVSWVPLFDKEPISSIGSIAVAPSDPNVIYVGTGEACIRGNISFGNGVHKSVDAGKTWTHIGLDDTRHIGRVIVDPQNSDIVFVAALGHAFGPNPERGVFRSADGGKTWQKVLYKDEKTGAIDITFAPTNSHILYAALWEAYRSPWMMSSGGPGSGLYKSIDGGATWTHLEGHGLPKGVLGRIGVSVSGADPNRIYALIEAEEGGLFRSNDGGETWQRVNDDHRFRQRAWYFTHVFADPKSIDTVYILNTGMYRSTDGGHAFSIVSAPHGDRHGLWIDPANSERMIEGDDGGATVSVDGGKSWTPESNQPTAQFYHVATDSRFPYYVYGAQQDNSTVAIASRSDNGVIDRPDWYSVGGGESGYIVPDPRNPNIVYAGSYDGLITRTNKANGQEKDISSWPENPMGRGAADLKYRFQWTAPIAVSPQDPDVIYHGAQMLFKTSDGGMTWTAISGDLTRNDKSKQKSSGGPIMQDNTSVEYYDTIFAIAPSLVAKDQIWVGTDDGLVQLTRDAGKHWTNVTPKDMPEWGTVSIIDPSTRDAGTAYMAVDRHRLDDFHAYIFKTADFGKTWTKLTGGLPDNSYVHVVREDPGRKGLLFAGTETGIWVSFDDGAHWQSAQLNLPPSPVHDLTIKGDDLVVATHGRAFWILDDITPLRQLSDAVENEDAHLFEPASALRFRGPGFTLPHGVPVGSNPPAGAIIDYSLKTAPKEAITLEILDGKGTVVRKYSSKKVQANEPPSEFQEFDRGGAPLPTESGLNRFVWDLRYEPPSRVPGAVSWGGRPNGPLAVPGKYQVKLTVAGKSFAAPLEVKEDPRIETSQADLEKQFNLALKIRDRVSEGHDAVNQIRALRGQLEALRKRLGSDAKHKAIVDVTLALDKKMNAVEEQLIQPKSKSSEDPLNFPIMIVDQLMALGSTVESSDSAPTQASYAVFDDLGKKLDEQLAAWKTIQSKDLAALNASVEKEKIPAVSIPPAENK
jgi:photosystem II stability/assembly factor-like uncharacterized protein